MLAKKEGLLWQLYDLRDDDDTCQAAFLAKYGYEAERVERVGGGVLVGPVRDTGTDTKGVQNAIK